MNVESLEIAIASDHNGYEYKEELILWLLSSGFRVRDFGTNSLDSVDYPVFTHLCTTAVSSGKCARGIVVGEWGNGESMTANRYHGIRCALCWNIESAEFASRHFNANMISIGQRVIGLETALNIVDVWLATPFDGGRHARCTQLIDASKDLSFDDTNIIQSPVSAQREH